MSDVWTTPRVIGLAPDASSVKAGQSQSKLSKWVSLGRREASLWGEVQGSGKKPYQVRIDLRKPAFKCSCPSRKFPCKHALGLMLILAEQPGKIAEQAELPEWVSDWLSSRQSRAEKREERAKAKADKPVDVEAQAKRLAKRENNVAAGIDELDRFLADLLREGLAAAQSRGDSQCERIAARMVDAQAPGLARLVHELATRLYSRGNWQERSLGIIAKLRLITRAYRRIEMLPQPMQHEVRAAVGFTQNTDELLGQADVPGPWRVVGQVHEDDGRIRSQRSWLSHADTGRAAMVLAFAAGTQPLDTGLVVGTQFDGELVFYPGSLSLRAVVKARSGEPSNLGGIAAQPIDAALDGYVAALSRCPWLERYPLAVADTLPMPLDPTDAHTGWQIANADGHRLRLAQGFDAPWLLHAISAGRPVTVFGEWDGQHLLPLSVWDGSAFYGLTSHLGVELAAGVSP